MPTTRISQEDHLLLQRLAQKTGSQLQEVLGAALREHERKIFFEELNADFARLRRDPKAWEEELQERALWDMADEGGLNRD